MNYNKIEKQTQTISMQNALIVFFILSFILLIFVFPFKIRFMCNFNIIKMTGFYSIKFWRIRILCGKIYPNEKGHIVILNSADIITKNVNNKFFKFLTKNIIKEVYVDKVEIYFDGGIKENSFASALLCGTVSSMIQALYGYLSQKYYYANLYEDISPNFKENELELTLDFVLSISVFRVLISIIKANIANNKLKEKENE